jgi:hypothetical protein
VIECKPRTIHNPDPFAFDLIQVRLEAIKISVCPNFWKKSRGGIVQWDISFCDTDEMKNRLHYSGRRRAPEILSAYHKDGESLSTGALACVGSDTCTANGADFRASERFRDTDERR